MGSWLRFTPHLLFIFILINFVWLSDAKLFLEPFTAIVGVGLLILTYFSAIFMVGRAWALLPTAFLAFSPFLKSASYEELVGALTAIATLDALGYFLIRPSRPRSILLATAITGAVYGNFDNFWLLPGSILIICLGATAGFFLYFNELDPAVRKNNAYLQLIRYGAPLLLMLAIAIPALMALGLFLPRTASPDGIMELLAANPVLEPIARYIEFFKLPREKISPATGLIQTLAWPGFIAAAWGALLATLTGIISVIKNLPFKFLYPTLMFIETRPLEFAVFGGMATAFIFNLTYAPVLVIILATNPIKAWCSGKSSYLSGGIRVNISAFDQRISNQALKYGSLAALLAAQIFLALN
jgi:hypothetical protein